MVAKGLICFDVDRSRITVCKNETVKIYVVGFDKSTVSNQELSRAKKTEGFHIINDRYTRCRKDREKPIYENAYIEMELDEEDK